jgi:restriction endonuclease Mrr
MLEILILCFGAIGVGFFLIFLLALADKKKKKTHPPEENALSPVQFKKACVAVIENMKLELEEVAEISDEQLDILAVNPTPIVGSRFLVRCVHLPPEELVRSTEVLEFSNTLVQERLSKGLFITTGRFADDISGLGELAPIEFIYGSALKGLMEKYRILFTS